VHEVTNPLGTAYLPPAKTLPCQQVVTPAVFFSFPVYGFQESDFEETIFSVND